MDNFKIVPKGHHNCQLSILNCQFENPQLCGNQTFMKGRKADMIITIVGGGSTFTAGIVKSIALRREELEVDEIRLFDLDKERQDKVAVVVDWILHQDLKCDIKLTVTPIRITAYAGDQLYYDPQMMKSTSTTFTLEKKE